MRELRSPPFLEGRPARFFYWDDEASRRPRPELLTSEQAEQDKLRS